MTETRVLGHSAIEELRDHIEMILLDEDVLLDAAGVVDAAGSIQKAVGPLDHGEQRDAPEPISAVVGDPALLPVSEGEGASVVAAFANSAVQVAAGGRDYRVVRRVTGSGDAATTVVVASHEEGRHVYLASLPSGRVVIAVSPSGFANDAKVGLPGLERVVNSAVQMGA